MASNESGCYYRMTTLGSISLNQNVKQPSSHTVHITVGLPFVHQISTSARWNSGSSGVSQYAIKCQLLKRLCSSLEPMHSGHSRSWTQPSGCYIEMACLYRTLNVIIDIMNITSALWIPVSLVHIHTALVPESMNSCISQLLLCMGTLRPITKVCCQNYAHNICADCILIMQVGNTYMKWLFYIVQRE